MDLRARRKLAFVIEHYGAEVPGEPERRTRSLAAAVAGKGHDVSVLTTCVHEPGGWTNELADGESSLDGVRVVRFRVDTQRSPLRDRISSHELLGRFRWAQQAKRASIGPRSPSLEQHLRQQGALYDAVFFTGAWGPLPWFGAPLVRNPVLAPPPMDDALHALADVAELLKSMRALAVAYPEHKDRLSTETRLAIASDAFVVGACCEPLGVSPRPFADASPVRGPFILSVGERGAHVDKLVQGFLTFRDAHALTPFEGDVDDTFEGRDLRLVLVGDFHHRHAPEDRVVSLGPMDDSTRRSLLRSALAVAHADDRQHLPVSLIEAWSLARPTLLMDPHPALRTATQRWASEYLCESYAFASCLAALLSRRAPRSALAARTAAHVRRAYGPGTVVDGMETCVEALRASQD